MPEIYKKGDVVNAYFPNDDLENPGVKLRPCVILDMVPPDDYLLICVTGTDWTGTSRGFWIKENTKAFSLMRLIKPSFINIDDIKKLPKSVIRNKKGYCPLIDEIEKILKT
jgi:hypothetical protein